MMRFMSSETTVLNNCLTSQSVNLGSDPGDERCRRQTPATRAGRPALSLSADGVRYARMRQIAARRAPSRCLAVYSRDSALRTASMRHSRRSGTRRRRPRPRRAFTPSSTAASTSTPSWTKLKAGRTYAKEKTGLIRHADVGRRRDVRQPRSRFLPSTTRRRNGRCACSCMAASDATCSDGPQPQSRAFPASRRSTSSRRRLTRSGLVAHQPGRQHPRPARHGEAQVQRRRDADVRHGHFRRRHGYLLLRAARAEPLVSLPVAQRPAARARQPRRAHRGQSLSRQSRQLPALCRQRRSRSAVSGGDGYADRRCDAPRGVSPVYHIKRERRGTTCTGGRRSAPRTRCSCTSHPRAAHPERLSWETDRTDRFNRRALARHRQARRAQIGSQTLAGRERLRAAGARARMFKHERVSAAAASAHAAASTSSVTATRSTRRRAASAISRCSLSPDVDRLHQAGPGHRQRRAGV